ncbi:MAG TPA: M48 family metallopeptidase [Pyrinomonadaceae bacterium]
MIQRESIRKFGAFFLAATVWVSAIAFFPAAAAAQAKQDSKDDKKAAQAKKDEKAKPKAQASAAKALGVKEDPSQIGKRKINSGSDKLFGWLGGSQEKEVALGRQLAMEVEQQAKLVEDPIVTEYINRVGQNVVLHSDAKIPFTIKVIDSDEVNAFALPGGFFFVNKGLILAADNESELAGVMAHEIAHVAARHAMENQGKMQAIQYGLLGTIIFGGGIASAIAQNAGGFAQLMSFLQFSRGAESEADVLGVQYLYASGYDPTGMSTMFEKLNSKNKKKPGTLSKIFATHPQSIDRRDATLALVARFPEKEEYVISTSEFQRVKAHLLKITNAKAGVTSDIDEEGNQKPTLKRRQPESTDDDVKDSGTSSSEAPPQLKKKGEEPAPVATPKP